MTLTGARSSFNAKYKESVFLAYFGDEIATSLEHQEE
tara:strand:+ start:591 stop:701 length:111 start_codon:yes stop_codon:yes gene_type:complete